MPLSNDVVQKLVSGILDEKLASTGYRGADVTFDSDFDGEPLIRAKAHLERPVADSNVLFDAADEIRTQLVREGDDRFVIITQDYPGSDEPPAGEELEEALR